MRVGTNYGGLLAGASATVIAALIGFLTALVTTRKQLAGQLAISQANINGQVAISQATIKTAEMQQDEADRKRLDEQTAWLVGELRKEIDRLKVTLEQQNARIDQLDAQNIKMRRALEQHGIPVPK